MIVLAGSPGRWSAAWHLFSYCDELSNPIHNLLAVFTAVSAFPAAAATLQPDLFNGCAADLLSIFIVTGTGLLLVTLPRCRGCQAGLRRPCRAAAIRFHHGRLFASC